MQMALLDGLFINLECPNCDYGMDVELLSVQLQETVFCPCCKVTIELVDADASVYASQRELDSAMNGLTRELNKLNQTITFNI